MNEWYQQQPGSWLMPLERAQIATVLRKIRGEYLVQLGGSSDLLHTTDSIVCCRFYLHENHGNQLTPDVRANFSELPLLSDSVDIVVLIHILEFADYPVQILEEVYRTLIPGGRLIILGFNPWSLWGLKKTLTREKQFPWKGKYWSRAQVSQWLRSYGCVIEMNKTLCFRSPNGKVRKRRATLFFEMLGQLCYPTFGGVYSIVARKQVYAPITEIKDWRKRAVVRRRLVEPTTRV